MGIVYEVDDLERGQRIALKTLKGSDPHTLYRLKREFRALADLSHRNLVDLYDLVIEGGSCFVTMELIRGQNFVDYNRNYETGAWDEARLRATAGQLAAGLHALHQAGMVHRDIKPSNVIVSDEGRVVLLDFGLIANITGANQDSLVGQIVGTVEYMAPEQAAGEPPTAAADWYSVGVLLYEVLTGRVPFGGSIMEVLLNKQQYPATPPRATVPDIPEDLDSLCLSLLARSPVERPSGRQILERLGMGGQPTEPRMTLSTALGRFSLAGRTRELERLERSLAEVREGQPAAVVVRGESGMGKSALIRYFVDRARQTDSEVIVLEGRCYERESVPYKAMDGVIDQLASYWMQLPPADAAALLPRHGALLRRLFPTLGRVPAVAATPPGPAIRDLQELRTQAFAALREVFEKLAERKPLILYLDDLQWVDADSVGLLSDLMRPPEAPPLLLVLAARTVSGDGGELDELLRVLDVDTATIDLGPLVPDAATEMARSLLRGPSEALAERVSDEAGGVPVFIEELALYLLTVASAEVARLTLEEVVEARLERLPEQVRRVMELAAIAIEPISQQVAATALDLSREDLNKDVRYLRTAMLLKAPPGSSSDRFEIYHDRLRSAVRRAITPGRRRELNRALALALEQWSEAPPERLARHWHEAGEAQRAAELARTAAEQAVRVVDFDRAARLYQLALRWGTYGNAEIRALRTAHAEALSNAGRAQDAAAAFSAAAEGADPVLALELRNRTAAELLRGGHIDDGLQALREVLAEIGLSLAPSPLRALVRALWRRVLLRLRGLGYRPRSQSEVPQRRLTELDIVLSVSISLANVDTMRGFEFQTRALLQALRLGEPGRIAHALGSDASFLATQGYRRRALRMAEQSHRLYEETKHDRPQMPFGLWAKGAIAYFIDNDWDQALAYFGQAEDEIRSTLQTQGWAMDMAQLWICFSRAYRGDYAEVARMVPRLVREAERRGDLYAPVCYRTRLNLIYLMRDRVDLAERALAEAEATWPPAERVGYQVQHFFALISRCELELYRNRPHAANERLERDRAALRWSLLRRVGHVDAELLHIEGRIAVQLAVAADDPRTRARHLARTRRCARRLEKLRTPMARNFALLLRAGEANAAGRVEEAARRLLDAIRALENARTMALAAAARRRLGELRQELTGEGEELIDQADRWMLHQRIRNPRRMTHMLVPGFALLEAEDEWLLNSATDARPIKLASAG